MRVNGSTNLAESYSPLPTRRAGHRDDGQNEDEDADNLDHWLRTTGQRRRDTRAIQCKPRSELDWLIHWETVMEGSRVRLEVTLGAGFRSLAGRYGVRPNGVRASGRRPAART